MSAWRRAATGAATFARPPTPLPAFISSGTTASGGPLGGLIGGYDYMFPNRIVLGGLVDVYATNITTNEQLVSGINVTQSHSKIDWLGTAQARLGYAFGNWLPYASFGFTWSTGSTTRDQITGTSGNAPPGTFEKVSTTDTGWVAGGGLDLAIDNLMGLHNMVAGIVYRYSSIGDFDAHVPGLSAPVDAHQQSQQHAARDADLSLLRAAARAAGDDACGRSAPPPPAAVAAKKQMFIVFFEFDKSTLTPDGKKVVDAAAAAFKSGKSDVAVAGYTDLAGTQQYNLALSHRRADAVKAALVKDGVSASAIGESWYGKQNPRVPTADGVREPQNRRVEITM